MDQIKEILKSLLYKAVAFLDSLLAQVKIYTGVYLGWLPYHNWIVLGLVIFIVVMFVVLFTWRRRRKARRALQRSRLKDGRDIRREAKREKRRKNYIRAGELFEMSERYDQAIKMYMIGKSPARAAQVYLERLKNLDRAVEIYLEHNLFESAARAYASVKNFSEAAKYFRKAGKELTAAEMHEKAHEYDLAGELYRKHKSFREAARCFGQTRDNIPAAEMYAAYYKEMKQTYADQINDEKKNAIQDLAKKAAYFYKQAGSLEECSRILLSAGLKKYAGEILLEMGKADEAAECFLDAGDQLRAAEIYEASGNKTKAAEIKAQYYQAKGQAMEAVRYFEEAGDYLQAADYYAGKGDMERAGELYQKGGDSKTAAEMFYNAGRADRAAGVMESVGDYQAALRFYEEAGDEAKLTELHDKLGNHFQAGILYKKRNLLDKAIASLQRVSTEDSKFDEACLRLGEIFIETGKYSLALEKLRALASKKPINPENLDLYYKLAIAYERCGELNFALTVYSRMLSINLHYQDVAIREADLRKRLSTPSPVQLSTGGASAHNATMVGAQPSGMVGTPTQRRYEIVKEIGRGGMGVVYLAKDLNLGRVVAYKVLPEDLKRNPQFVTNFIREAKSLAQLSHPYIVAIYDAGEDRGNYFIIMEYVEGENLKDLIQKSRRVPLKIGVQIFSQLCQAIDYAHSRKVVHRDIKTGNIMWTKNQAIKVMDFGLAKALEDARSGRTMVSGTPYYMSPEQTLGKPLDHRTDIYSMGVSMYEIFTGTLPFREGDIGYQQIHAHPKAPRDMNPEIPEGLNKILLKCLAKDPEQRYQNAREIYLEIKAIE